VATLGLNETSFLKATRLAPIRYVTGLVDLEQGRLLDVVADRTSAAVDRWLHARTRDWLAGIGTVALDPWRGYASALVVPLGHARVVVDHFHAIKLANTVVDQAAGGPSRPPLGIGAASQIRWTASASCCLWPPSSSPGGDGYGYGPGWPPVILVVRW
jgi:Transposase